MAFLDLETALLIVDDDLPDGLYFLLLSDLTGLSPAAVEAALVERGPSRRTEPVPLRPMRRGTAKRRRRVGQRRAEG